MTAAPLHFPVTRPARRDFSSVLGSPRLRKIPVGRAPETEPNGDPDLLRVCL
jgi:hypothetical protein